MKYNFKQENPPVGNRKRRTAHLVTCPYRDGGPQSLFLGGGRTPGLAGRQYHSPGWGLPKLGVGTPQKRSGTRSWEGTWDQWLG